MKNIKTILCLMLAIASLGACRKELPVTNPENDVYEITIDGVNDTKSDVISISVSENETGELHARLIKNGAEVNDPTNVSWTWTSNQTETFKMASSDKSDKSEKTQTYSGVGKSTGYVYGVKEGTATDKLHLKADYGGATRKEIDLTVNITKDIWDVVITGVINNTIEMEYNDGWHYFDIQITKNGVTDTSLEYDVYTEDLSATMQFSADGKSWSNNPTIYGPTKCRIKSTNNIEKIGDICIESTKIFTYIDVVQKQKQGLLIEGEIKTINWLYGFGEIDDDGRWLDRKGFEFLSDLNVYTIGENIKSRYDNCNITFYPYFFVLENETTFTSDAILKFPCEGQGIGKWASQDLDAYKFEPNYIVNKNYITRIPEWLRDEYRGTLDNGDLEMHFTYEEEKTTGWTHFGIKIDISDNQHQQKNLWVDFSDIKDSKTCYIKELNNPQDCILIPANSIGSNIGYINKLPTRKSGTNPIITYSEGLYCNGSIVNGNEVDYRILDVRMDYEANGAAYPDIIKDDKASFRYYKNGTWTDCSCSESNITWTKRYIYTQKNPTAMYPYNQSTVHYGTQEGYCTLTVNTPVGTKTIKGLYNEKDEFGGFLTGYTNEKYRQN